MKKIIAVLILVSLSSCAGQSTIKKNKTHTKIKKDTMEYFNIDKYKDLEIDHKYSSDENTKYLKKENDRIRIIFDNNTIDVKQTNIQNAYGLTKVYYSKNKILKSILYKFYSIQIKKYTQYDEIGKIVVEEDLDKPYKFSLKEVIAKVKKEYGVDLEDLKQGAVLERFISIKLNKKPLYNAYLRINEDPDIIDYIIIDGTTGETLYRTIMLLSNEHELPPYYRYIESLKKAEEENNAYYKSYKGKDYTKKEWEAFEEEWHKNYEEKKNSKGFWDDIFKRP